MLSRFWAWIKGIFGASPKARSDAQGVEAAEAEYRRIDQINFAAIFGQRLSNIAFSDSTQTVTDADGREGGARAEIVRGALDWTFRRARKITTQVLATGGRVIVPCVGEDGIRVDVIEQERLYITDTDGDKITGAAILADSATVNSRSVYRWAGYTLEGGNLIVRNRATDDNGHALALSVVDAWAEIPEEYAISGVDRLPFAYLRCPGDSRKTREIYGAPITYGSESVIAEIRDQMKIIAREYRLTRPMLGLDATLWKARKTGGAGIDDVRRTVQDSEDPFIPVEGYADETRPPWMIYAPTIRDGAMYARLDRLFELLEKTVGTSRGILTARETASATATEIRAANHDTFTMISAIREMWATAMDDLAYAVDVLAEHFGLTPAGGRGDWAIAYDWDMSLFESSEETFNQLVELQSRGAISLAELRQWVRGGSIEDAEAAIQKIRESGEGASTVDRLLAGMGATEEE